MVERYAEGHAFVEAALHCTAGQPIEQTRMTAQLGHHIESDAMVERSHDIAAAIPDSADKVMAWSSIYAVTGSPEAVLATHEAIDQLPTATAPHIRFHAMKVAAEQLGDTDLARRIIEKRSRMGALLTIALHEGAQSDAYQIAHDQAVADRDWAALARLARMTGDPGHVRELDLDCITNVDSWLDVAIAAHRAGEKRVLRTARNALHTHESTTIGNYALTQGINTRMAEEGLPFLAALHKHPVLQADALLHMPPEERTAARHRRIRALLQQPGTPVSRAAAALSLAEQTHAADDIAFAATCNDQVSLGETDAVLQGLQERLLILQESVEGLQYIVPLARRPRAVAAIAHRQNNVDLMNAARVTAYGLRNPLERAKALHAVAMIALDCAVATDALESLVVHDRATSLVMARAGVATFGPRLPVQDALQRISRQYVVPPEDSTLWRRRMAALGALRMYDRDIVAMPEAVVSSPTMADYVAAASARAAAAVAPVQQEKAFMRQVRQRLARHLDSGGSSAGAERLADAICYTKDAAGLSMLYEGMAETPVGRRIMSALMRQRDYRAMRRAEDTVLNLRLPWKHRAALLADLVQPYRDDYVSQAEIATGVSGEVLVNVVAAVRERYGVTLDSGTLTWLLGECSARPSYERPSFKTEAEVIAAIDSFYRASAVEYEQMLAEESAETLMRRLQIFLHARTTYFLHAVGQVSYSRSPAFTPRRFNRFISGVRMYDVDQARFGVFLRETHLPSAIGEALWRGEPPVPRALWDIPTQSLPDIYGASVRASFADCGSALVTSADYEESLALITSVCGDAVARICRGGTREIDAQRLHDELLHAQPRLAYRITQYRDALRSQGAERELVRAWTQYAQWVRSIRPTQLPLALAGFMRRDPTYPTSGEPSMALPMHDIKVAAQAGDVRIRARMLDKKHDLAMYSRFADATNNCYQSLSLDRLYASRAPYFDRVWRDPCMFAVQIESAEGNNEPCGFVFGTIGQLDDMPALILNGVYLQKRNNRVAQAVIRSMRDHVARPMGLRALVFAARHGGSFDPGVEYASAEGHRITRYSALRTQGELVRSTFDDIHTSVNEGPVIGQEHTWYQQW